MNAEPNHGAPEASEADDSRAEAGAGAADSASSLRGRIRPLPAETDDEIFLPFLDLCFNWSMDRPRIEIDELRNRSDAAFYYRDWGRDGDIAVAAHAEADSESPIVGLAWVRLADIADVVGKADDRVGGDFAAALGKTGAEVVRSEVVPDRESGGGKPADSEAGGGETGDGKLVDGESGDGKLVDGESGDGEPVDGESGDGEPVDGESGDGEPVDGNKRDDQSADHESTANLSSTANLATSEDGAPFTGYGWVAADIPELSIAVLPDHQGQGIGGALVDTVCALARMSGFPAVSLSVSDGNGAAKLYTDHGFVSVGRSGDSDVLVRRLG
ncbi:GNAT family N-acetyltransferase [Brevibacterium oceani]|uniref:GNAT family N-acetyltransferase n=1 Tax=Brevibacterium oceani TaxID=358099 RepID=UPI0015E66B12|nr:GNAT family N-acetyltransferase [Brevibacterium oceani]